MHINILIILGGLVCCKGIEIPTSDAVTSAPEDRIVGGVPAVSSTNNVCIKPVNATLAVFVCGGTVLSENRILTACHCVTYESLFIAVFARIGSLSCNTGGEVYLSIPTGMICHPCYDSKTADYDVAVIDTIGSMKLNQFQITPIQLPEPGEEVPGGTPVRADGWGTLTYQGAPSFDALQTVNTVIVDPTQCAQLYAGTGLIINDNKICAGNTVTGGQDTCQGDSGGALRSISTGKQLGITSNGIGCGDPKYPGVYTKVSKHVCWIKKTMQGLICSPLLGCCGMKCGILFNNNQ